MKKTLPTKANRLAKKLRKIRIDLELSQNQFLARLGFANELFRSNISQDEHGVACLPHPYCLRTRVWRTSMSQP